MVEHAHADRKSEIVVDRALIIRKHRLQFRSDLCSSPTTLIFDRTKDFEGINDARINAPVP